MPEAATQSNSTLRLVTLVSLGPKHAADMGLSHRPPVPPPRPGLMSKMRSAFGSVYESTTQAVSEILPKTRKQNLSKLGREPISDEGSGPYGSPPVPASSSLKAQATRSAAISSPSPSLPPDPATSPSVSKKPPLLTSPIRRLSMSIRPSSSSSSRASVKHTRTLEPVAQGGMTDKRRVGVLDAGATDERTLREAPTPVRTLDMESADSVETSISTSAPSSSLAPPLLPEHRAEEQPGVKDHIDYDDHEEEEDTIRQALPPPRPSKPPRPVRPASGAHELPLPFIDEDLLPTETSLAPSASLTTPALSPKDAYIVFVITYLLESQPARVNSYISALEDCRRSHRPYDECIRLCTATSDTDMRDLSDAILCAMQEIYDDHTLVKNSSESDRRSARRILMKVSQKIGAVPSTLFVQSISSVQTNLPVGMGSYADVFQGSMGDQTVALKRLRTYAYKDNKDRWKGPFFREALLWRQLHSDHILEFIGLDKRTFDGCICMVSPLMSYGDLARYIGNHPNIGLEQKIQWAKGVVSGLHYLHGQEVVHGDLRGANILLDDQLQVHIADFGLSMLMDAGLSTMGVTTAREGAMRWMAPEVIHSGVCTTQGDIYSLGCVFLEIFSETYPFPDLKNEKQVISHINQGERPQWHVKLDNSNPTVVVLERISKRCWSENSEKRPSAEEVLNINAFQTVQLHLELSRKGATSQAGSPDAPLVQEQRSISSEMEDSMSIMSDDTFYTALDRSPTVLTPRPRPGSMVDPDGLAHRLASLNTTGIPNLITPFPPASCMPLPDSDVR